MNRTETGLRDLLEAFQSVSAELARVQDIAGLADEALQLSLDLTRSSIAFIGIVDAAGEPKRIFSRAANPADTMSAGEPKPARTSRSTPRRPRSGSA